MSRKMEEFEAMGEMLQRRERLRQLAKESRGHLLKAERAARMLRRSIVQSPNYLKASQLQLQRWTDAIILNARSARLTALALDEEL